MRIRDASFFRLKAAMADLIERCGGQRRAGEIVGLSQQMMSRVCQRDDGAMLSLEAKLGLERECGEPIVSRIEAELLGCRLEPIEQPAFAPGASPFDAHAQVMTEVGDLCRSFAVSVADGKYSRTDAATVDRDLTELARSIERFRRVNAATMAGAA